MLFAALTASLILAITLQARHVRWPLAVPLAALLVPLAVLFGAFVYPGDPDLREWWLLAAGAGLFFGLLTASVGYVSAQFLQGQRKD